MKLYKTQMQSAGTIFNLFLSILFIILVLLNQLPANAEFYEYIDENGVKVFTDDQLKIPLHNTNRTTTHKEQYDGMDETEKNRLILLEEQEIEQSKKKTKAWLEQYELKELEIEKSLQQKKEALEKQRKREELSTPVLISNNQIIVPVEFNSGGKWIKTMMLLDTGSNITTISQSLADQLGINRGKKSTAQVAGGAVIRTKIIIVDKIQVGKNSLSTHKVMVFRDRGPSSGFQGLLGQDFLGQFRYTIDYSNSVIVWDEN